MSDEHTQDDKKNNPKWAINPLTGRYIASGGVTYSALVRQGHIDPNQPALPPGKKLLVEKRVKTVSCLKNLSGEEVDDIYEQLTKIREERKTRPPRGRPPNTEIRYGKKAQPSFLVKPPPVIKRAPAKAEPKPIRARLSTTPVQLDNKKQTLGNLQKTRARLMDIINGGITSESEPTLSQLDSDSDEEN